ncbi:MAG: hypothetical protein ACYC8T_00230 [Myxococcaceae bacterium]
MAKGARKRKEKEQAAGPKGAFDSLLELAFARYEAGDVVTARRVAKRLLEVSPAAADEAAAKKVWAALAPLPAPGAPAVPQPSVHELAKLIIERTRVPPKAYLFAAVAAGVFTGLLALALTRS